MSDLKHTPGPWEAKELFKNWLVVDSKDNVLNIRDNEANAKLIAAAPEMLEALKNIVDYWNSGNFSRDRKMWSNMESIIKKATE